MTKITDPKFQEQDISVQNPVYFPEIEDKVSLALAKLLGYDRTNQKWRKINVDAGGNLGLSSSAAASSDGNITKTTVTTTAVALLSANATRIGAAIYNGGSNSVYLGFNSGVTTSTGLNLLPGAAIDFENHTGAIYAISTGSVANVYGMERY